jgi:hypothetical protein
VSKRRVAAGVFAAAAVLVLGFLPQTPAMATGDNFLEVCTHSDVSCQDGTHFTNGTPPGDHCATAPDDTRVCIVYDGDVVYVKDGQVDSHSALGLVETDSGVPLRICRNPYGSGSWARCDFDWIEDAMHKVSGGEKTSYTSYEQHDLWSFTSD